MAQQWGSEHFVSREYLYEDDRLNNAQIRLVVQVNGKTEIDLTSRREVFEPGLIAFYSRPDEEGIRVVKVTPAREGAIVDGSQEMPRWAAFALGLER